MPSILAWKDPACPLTVEYSPETVERIRLLALEGLLSLPRVGLGVGGFLMGTRKSGKTIIVGFHPIPCSHASGPSFLPTEAEIKDARASAGGIGLEILGCYCSRPRKDLAFGEREHALLDALCPEDGQLALLIRPSATEATRAALFFRTPARAVAGGTARPLEPLELPPELPAVEARPNLFGEPEPVSPPVSSSAPPHGSPWLRRTLLAGAVLGGILTGGFFTRDWWLPRPPLELRTAETNGHFAVEWNRAAVRGLGRGVLTLTDGPVSREMTLNADQLQSGSLAYARKTPNVTAVLVAGDASATARFVAPPAPEPSHP